MAHGTWATVKIVADTYAEVFSRNGLATLLYDHRHFGRSEKEPRQEINPWILCRGYRDAIAFAETLSEFDSKRIALWGDSCTGGQVVVVAAMDDRVKAIVAQCPVIDETLPMEKLNPASFETLKDIFNNGGTTGDPETTTEPLPVVSCDQAGTLSLLKPIRALRWFIDYGGRHGTGWENWITRVIPRTRVPCHPFLCAPFVEGPVVFMVAPEDEMVHADYNVVKNAYKNFAGPKERYDIAGGHFGLRYFPGALFDEAGRLQTNF